MVLNRRVQTLHDFFKSLNTNFGFILKPFLNHVSYNDYMECLVEKSGVKYGVKFLKFLAFCNENYPSDT